jgi:hypothetical protein
MKLKIGWDPHRDSESELRTISGTIEKLDGNRVSVSLSEGISLVVHLDSEPRVNTVTKGSGSDLKAGSQVTWEFHYRREIKSLPLDAGNHGITPDIGCLAPD